MPTSRITRSSLWILGLFGALFGLGGCSNGRSAAPEQSERDAYLATHISNEDTFSVHNFRILQTSFFNSCMCEIRVINGKLQVSSERIANENIVKKEYVADPVMESEIRNLLYSTLRLLDLREIGQVTDEEMVTTAKQSLYIVSFQQAKQPEKGIPAALFETPERKILMKLLQETQQIHQR